MATRITRPLKFLAVSIALLGTACTVSSTDAPGLTGPSELALSFALAAQPDTITQNGTSQSVITLSARDVNGKAVPSKVFRLDMLVGRSSPIEGAAAQNYGTLSARTVVTSSEGKATVVYTAPPGPPNGAVIGSCAPSVFSPSLPGPCVTIAATPIESAFLSGTNSQIVDIHLIPIDIIPVPGSPVADFTWSPTSPAVNAETQFSAGSSFAASGRTLISYQWDWGDGSHVETGVTQDHDWIAAGSFFVTLTVTDDAGNKSSTTKTITVH